MSSRSEKSKNALRDRHQSILSEMLKEDANRLCADCCAKGPRWASWNIGVFVCIRCAGIHRNLGVHISKVKSVNLDSWTPVQMDHIVQWGNQRCKEVYECYLPKDFVRPQGDSAMETFIRSKYERKLYIIKGDISTAGLSANPKTIKKQKQEDKPLTSAPSKVERPSKVTQESKTTSKSKPSPSLMAPATIPTKVSSTPSTTSSSVDDLLSMGDFQGVNTNVPSSSAQSSNVDLFGLESCPDAFQSQPAPQQIGQSNSVSMKQDPFSLNGSYTTTEQDLFPDDNTTKPVKSAKDTIMSLYASNSSQQSSNAMYGVPGGVYMATNNTHNSNQGSNYNNYQQYPAQPQFHGNSHFHQAPQGQMLPQQQQPRQQQPLHHQMQQMNVNNGQMHYNANQQYANNGGQQYQQPHPMGTPMYAKNMNNSMANQTMMPSNWSMPATNQQQPIVVNGNTSGMGMTAMNPNTQGSMGHTLSTQLWN